jgi:hypothetical protein
MKFQVRLHLRVPPEYLADWWLDYSDSDSSLSGSILQRQVGRDPDGTIHLVTLEGRDRHTARTSSTVRRTGPLTFHEEGEMEIDGKPAALISTDFHVDGDVDGSQLVADFRFRPRTWGLRLAFPFQTGRFRRERQGAFREFGRALTSQYARHEPPIAPPTP